MVLAAITLSWCLVGQIAVQVEEVGELERQKAETIARGLGRAIEAHTSSTATVEDAVWWGCREQELERCVAEVRARSGATEVVLLRLFESVRSIRIIARRFHGQRAGAEETLDLDRDAADPSASLSGLARRLFREARPAPIVNASPPPPAADDEAFRPWPWVFFGTALATGAAGAGFLASSSSARSELESDLQSHEAFARLDRRVFGHGLVGGFLVCVAFTALVAGTISLFWIEPDLYIAGQGGDGQSQATSLFLP